LFAFISAPGHAAVPAVETFSVAVTSADATSIIVNKPTGTIEGDLLVAIMSTDGGALTLGAPDGWTAITNNIGTTHTSRSWYKIAGASEPTSYTFTVSASESIVCGILRISGHDSSNPIDVSGTATGTSNAPTSPDVTTTVADTLVLRYFGADDDDMTQDSGYPSAHTGVYVRGSLESWGETSSGVAYTTQASAGATGTAAFSITAAEEWSAVTIAIAPSGSAVSAALTGTLADNATEAEIVSGNETLIITLTGDEWVASGATFDAQRQNIINGLVSAQSETYGWNNEVAAVGKQSVEKVVWTSSTVVTITLDAQSAYDITADETITVTVPGTAVVGGSDIVATPTFDIIGPCSGTFSYRKEITIQSGQVSGTSDHPNFPVLISLSGSWLRTTTADPTNGRIENASGYDIIFKDTGGTQLDHEIEDYDGSASAGTLVAWVRIPTLKYNENTIIYMYYGNSCIDSSTQNPTGVWDSNFKGVWHLSETGSGGAIELVSYSTATDPGGGDWTITVDKPTDVQDGDVLIGHVAQNEGGGTMTGPSGWTQIYQYNGLNEDVGAWYKVITDAAGEPSSYTWTNPSQYELSLGAITNWRGVDNTNPINANGGQSGNSNTPTAPSITTDTDNCQILAQNMATGETHTPPSGMTERYDFANALSLTLADVNQASAGATEDKQFTASASGPWYAATIALAPAVTIEDSTSNGNDGTDSGSPTFQASGQIGNAIDFDGIDDYVEVPDSNSLDIVDEITLVAWTKDPTVTFYFDGYDAGQAWTRNPEYMVDNNTANYAKINYENASEETQLNNFNTCPGTDLGTISKVEFRALVDIWGAGHLYMRPIFTGGDGDEHDLGSEIYSTWTSYIDITTDTNGPSPWTWSDVQNLDMKVRGTSGIDNDISCAKIEILVTYTSKKTILNKGEDAYALKMSTDGSTLYGYINNTEITTPVSSPTSWHQFVLTYDGANQKLFIDGGQATSSPLTGNISTNITDLEIGDKFSGLIDEVRVSNTVRSAGWIETEYNNQKENSTFYLEGDEDDLGDCSYSFYKPITIESDEVFGTSDHTNFPLLINIASDDDLRTKANNGDVENIDGYDIIFRDSSGRQLDHEIEQYEPTSGKLVAWVRIPTLSHDTDMVIYMYYGNTCISSSQENVTGVWNSNYKGVWHLGEEYALDFNGSTDYVRITESSSIEPAAVTISYWVKRDGSQIEYAKHLSKAWQDDSGPTYASYGFEHDTDSQISFYIGEAGGYNGVQSSANAIPDGTWVHVVGTYDPSASAPQQKLYIDGVLDNSDTNTAAILYDSGTDADLYFSAEEPSSPSYPFDGTIDEVRIWNRALGPTEVSDLYNGDPVSRTGLVGEWLMDEGSGNTVSDSSGEGNDGDMTGHAATWIPIVKDSTSNDNDGTSQNMTSADQVTGQIDGSIDFDGSNDYIDVSDDASLRISDYITVEAWINPTATDPEKTIISKWGDNEYDRDLYFMLKDGVLQIALDPVQGTEWNTGLAISTGIWAYVAVVYNGSTIKAYKDDVTPASTDASGTLDLGTSTNALYIGKNTPWGEYFPGILDEVRISDIPRDADWIKTCYYNQKDGSTFYIIGDETSYHPTVVDLISFTATGQDDSVLVEWETAQEIDNLGFNLYRTSDPGGSYTKLNSSLIPGLISSVSGQQYAYIDRHVTRDVLYYYLLEDVDLSGTRTMHGPICVDWDGDGLPDDYDEDPDDDSDDDADESPEVRIPELRFEEVDFGPEGWTPSSSNANWVKLSSFRARQGDEGIALEWETSFEVDNFGFHVYRELDGKFYRITPDLVPGSVFKVGAGRELPAGQSYMYWDGLSEGTGHELYWLDCVELNGGRASFGPIKPEIYGQPVSERLKVRFKSITRHQVSRARALGKARELREELSTKPIQTQSSKATFRRIDPEKPSEPRLPPNEEQWSLAAQPGVKIYIREDGWYRVGKPELVSAGLSPDVDPRYLQLYADGEEKSMMVTGSDDGRFDPLDVIEFYGTGLDTPFTDAHVYWLVIGSRPGWRVDSPFVDIRLDLSNRMRLPRGLRGRGAPLSFPFSLELKERTFYFAALKNGERDNFFGSVISQEPVDQLLTVAHPDLSSPEDAMLEVVLQGGTDSTHQIKIMFNYVEVGEVVFSGQEREAVEIQVPHDLLLEGDNIVTLIAQGGAMDVSLVDYIRLTYWRTYTADEDVLQFKASGGEWFSIGGFSSSEIQVVDITDPMRMFNIRGKVRTQDSGYAITVKVPSAGERTLLAFTEDKIKLPAGIEANLASSWHEISQGAEVIIIGHSDLLESVGFLKELREQQGWSVVLVDVEDLYDEFNFGSKNPWALKDFLGRAYEFWNPQPRFVLLVGDTSYDPRSYLGFGEFDLVPTKFVDTAHLTTASDDWFVDFDDDGLPEMAVGRLPVESAEEAATVVSKIISYEGAAGLMGEALLVADINDFFDFEGASAEVSEELLERSMEVKEILRGRSATARSDLLNLLNQGQLLVNYLGHGSTKTWNGNLLTSLDAWSLTNSPYLPFLVSMTCLNGFFQDPYIESMAETFLKAERGGAVAVWTSSGLTLPEEQAVMNLELIRLLFNGQGLTIGEAVMGAKRAVTNGDIRRTWILFGDPTLRLR